MLGFGERWDNSWVTVTQELSVRIRLFLLICLCTVGAIAHGGEWTPIRMIAIDYPLLGVQSATTGAVRLECELRIDGTVDTARVAFGPMLLGGHALKSVTSWRFRYEGDAQDGVRRVAVLLFEFRLTEPAPGPPKAQFEYLYPNRFTVTSTRLYRSH